MPLLLPIAFTASWLTMLASSAATSRLCEQYAAALRGLLRQLQTGLKPPPKQELRAPAPTSSTRLLRRRQLPMKPSTSALLLFPRLTGSMLMCSQLLRSAFSGNICESFPLIRQLESGLLGLNYTLSSAFEGAMPSANQALPKSTSGRLMRQVTMPSSDDQSSYLALLTRRRSLC